MSTETRERKFTTIRIRRETKQLIEDAALDREALWVTMDRIVKEYLVTRLKK